MEAPPAAMSEGRRVRARSLAVGVLGSHGGSVGRPALLPGSVPSPGSGMRHDARVRSGVTKEFYAANVA